MIFGWKKSGPKLRPSAGEKGEVFRLLRSPSQDEFGGLIRFENVSLPPSIQGLSLEIPLGSWVMLYGDDDFAKALFCDLCFSYILPESGRVHPVLKGGDVSFLGRSNTTYGRTLVDHLSCGVRENSKELMEFVARNVLSDRFRRHLSATSSLEFNGGRRAQEMELDERDFLEVAEANLVLQKRKAAVIDTTSDFYQIALEQGFRHSDTFLQSGKTILWIVDESQPLPKDAAPWSDAQGASVKKTSLSFPSGSRAGYLN
jgi:hypothetical protein